MASRRWRREAVFTVGAVLAAFALFSRRHNPVAVVGCGCGRAPVVWRPSKERCKGGKRLLVFQALHGSGRRTRCSCRGNVGDASSTGVFQAQRHFHGWGVAGCPRSGGGGRQRLHRWLETGGYFPLRIPLLLLCSLRFHHFQLVPHRLHLIWLFDLGRLFRLIMIGEARRILGQ